MFIKPLERKREREVYQTNKREREIYQNKREREVYQTKERERGLSNQLSNWLNDIHHAISRQLCIAYFT